MKIIKMLTKQIQEELKGAKEYIKDAHLLKLEHPQLSVAYAEMSEQEMTHAMKLHSFVLKLIEQQRAISEPPPCMLEMWEEKHSEMMELMGKIKGLQSIYMR